ncbi:putative Beta-ketoadipate enol-lactone hydrolase [Cupriavidus sp. U2]|uniref:3-oxoadipate enol-lactonase n=1 Tax=Cupriavidus sp. U2 TaxID=2920269 RepID=UPI00129E4AAF|nr:3-oxoadipate enol-lactonase [Cupriavidus sp. U2]KAI3594442.1 putative Beta-ketoadipate enol-lactone hydrolase [Cupriavidus sp. U2]
MPDTLAQRIRAGDVQLQARIDGREGPWVVLIHALGANLTLWDDTARHLSDRYRVLRFDLRGHGGSDAPVGAYTMTRLADDAVALMDALDIGQAHVCGVSVGGMVAQTLGVRHPDRLLSLTLVDTIDHTPMEAHPMWANRIGQAEAHGMAGLAPSTMERWLTQPFRAQHPDQVERINRMLLATPVQGYVGVAQAIVAFDLADAIGRIHCPTLVVTGDKDEGAPVSMAQSIAQKIHGAKLEVLPDAAHLSFIEQPERFHAIFDAFLGHAACGGQCDIP